MRSFDAIEVEFIAVAENVWFAKEGTENRWDVHVIVGYRVWLIIFKEILNIRIYI